MNLITYGLVAALMIACPASAMESTNAPTLLCDGTSFARAIAGSNEGWAPFIGKWGTTRSINHPTYEGKTEELEISFEPAPDVKGGNNPYVWRGLSRQLGGSSFSYGNYLGVSALSGAAIVEGAFPNAVVFWREGDTLRYVGYSPNPGCVSMTLSRTG